jgi:hypothetical protein
MGRGVCSTCWRSLRAGTAAQRFGPQRVRLRRVSAVSAILQLPACMVGGGEAERLVQVDTGAVRSSLIARRPSLCLPWLVTFAASRALLNRVVLACLQMPSRTNTRRSRGRAPDPPVIGMCPYKRLMLIDVTVVLYCT